MFRLIYIIFICFSLVPDVSGKSARYSTSIGSKLQKSLSSRDDDQFFVLSSEQPRNINLLSEAENHGHKMSLSTLIISMVADLCPHGMLPLAYGLSQGGPTGLIPAFTLMAIFGTASGYTMTSLAYMAKESGVTGIGGLWSNLISPKTTWIAESSIFALCFGCCVFYSAFIGDIFSAVASAAGMQGLMGKRWVLLGAISTLILLPLCLLEDMSALQFSSVLGVFGIGYTLFFHAKRMLDGSYHPDGQFFELLSERLKASWEKPSFK